AAGRVTVAPAAIGVLAGRAEKKLVTAGLAWLEAAARARPDTADEVAEAATVAFGQSTFDVQKRAVALVAALALSPATQAQVANAAASLPHDRRAALGGGSTPAVVVAAAPAPDPSRSAPPPIGSPGELAEELAAFLHQPNSGPIVTDVAPM